MRKLIIILILLAGFMSTAQKKQERLHKEKMTSEQIATLQTKKMTLALDLSQSQQKQIQELNVKNAEIRKTKMEKRKAKKENEGTKKLSSEERYAMQIERLDHQIAQKTEIKKILSKEQMVKWEKMTIHKKRKHLRKKKGPRKESK